MAQFRVGDRARLINVANAVNEEWRVCGGDEVTILALPADSGHFAGQYCISRPQHYPRFVHGNYYSPGTYLAPLVDSAVDAFLARIRKLGSEPVNDAPKVTVREG